MRHDTDWSASRLLTANNVKSDKEYTDRLLVKTRGKALFLHVDDIDWVEARGNYLRLHASGDSYFIRQTMNEMEMSLDPRKFIRIHRSAIVNIERIKQLSPKLHGDYAVQLHNGLTLTLSRGYKHRITSSLQVTP